MIRRLLSVLGLVEEKKEPEPKREWINHETITIKREHQAELRELYDFMNRAQHPAYAALFAFWSTAEANYPEVGDGNWRVDWDRLTGKFQRYTYDFPPESSRGKDEEKGSIE